MKKDFSMIFGGAIAYILLFLYAGTLSYMIIKVIYHSKALAMAACTLKPPVTLEFREGITLVVTLIGGLISALVVAKLAETSPGETPQLMRLPENASRGTQKASSLLAVGYLMVWLLCGLAALIIGVMVFPGISNTLADIGTTWLGLAVASGYAYFGLSPKK